MPAEQRRLPAAATTSYEVQADYHNVSRMVTRTYNRHVPCGTTTSGYGNSSYSTTRYCNQTESRQETVTERVVDAACNAEVRHRPVVGAAYLIQFDFDVNGQCRVQCLRQTAAPDGQSFSLMPCGPDEPPGGPVMPPPVPVSAGGEAPVRAPPPPETPWWERAAPPDDAGGATPPSRNLGQP